MIVPPYHSACHVCPWQDWGSELVEALKSAGGKAYSNYAVGFNNVKVEEATKRGIPVGEFLPVKQKASTGLGGDKG